jgi:hypothetical protein
MGKKEKHILIIGLALLTALYVNGCGKAAEEKGEVVNYDKPLPVKADNPQVKEFNQQLGEIKDLPTAEKAVNSFVTYVDSRIVKPDSGVKTMTLRTLMTNDLINKVARRELEARGFGGVASLSGSEESEPARPLIDVGTITDSVNSQVSDEGVRINDQAVQTAKDAVETSVPNLNPEKNETMTPLNAMAVGYALASGDDGTAPAGSVNIPLDKAASFVDVVTQ